MRKMRRSELARKFSIAEDVIEKDTTMHVGKKVYSANGIFFVGNHAICTNGVFILYGKALDIPDTEDMDKLLFLGFEDSEDNDSVMEVLEGSELSVPKDKFKIITNNTVISYIKDIAQKGLLFPKSAKIVVRKTEMLNAIQQIYGREKTNKKREAFFIRVDNELGLLRIKPARFKKKDIKREEAIAKKTGGTEEILIPFEEGTTTNIPESYYVPLRVDTLELIRVFDSEFITIRCNPNPVGFSGYSNRGIFRTMITGNNDNSISLELSNPYPSYNPYE